MMISLKCHEPKTCLNNLKVPRRKPRRPIRKMIQDQDLDLKRTATLRKRSKLMR